MKFYTPIHIRFNDIDAMGHVNNAIFFHYVEEARIQYFRTVLSTKRDWKTEGVLVARNEIDYFKPLLFKDQLNCGVAVTKIGVKSMETTTSFVVNEAEVARAKNVLVAFNHEKNTTIPIPQDWIDRFKDFGEEF